MPLWCGWWMIAVTRCFYVPAGERGPWIQVNFCVGDPALCVTSGDVGSLLRRRGGCSTQRRLLPSPRIGRTVCYNPQSAGTGNCYWLSSPQPWVEALEESYHSYLHARSISRHSLPHDFSSHPNHYELRPGSTSPFALKTSQMAAQECSGSNSPTSQPRNSVAPATTMLSKSLSQSRRHVATVISKYRLEIPPLDADRFRGSLDHFRWVKGLDEHVETQHVGGREVDLHSLHIEFMNNHGYNTKQVPRFLSHFSKDLALKRERFPLLSLFPFFFSGFFFSLQGRQDLWLKIGRELHLIDSPDVDSAPDEVANRLATIYEENLRQFDAIYVLSFVEEFEYRKAHDGLIG